MCHGEALKWYSWPWPLTFRATFLFLDKKIDNYWSGFDAVLYVDVSYWYLLVWTKVELLAVCNCATVWQSVIYSLRLNTRQKNSMLLFMLWGRNMDLHWLGTVNYVSLFCSSFSYVENQSDCQAELSWLTCLCHCVFVTMMTSLLLLLMMMMMLAPSAAAVSWSSWRTHCDKD